MPRVPTSEIKHSLLGSLAMPKIKATCFQVHILSFLHLDYSSSFRKIYTKGSRKKNYFLNGSAIKGGKEG